ncbi:hypothetical protein [Chromobacterium subtsugae]|uniref:hypothetical protein n=1 Tax=Chromobacterium subtsugae TaxID=251747 RepID=UPI0006411DA0|nr:hypothetical protein [Chromobacterium subtsugae]
MPFPWFWIFAPQINLPFSGNVLQDIDPATYWLNLFAPWQGGRWQWHELGDYHKALDLLALSPAAAEDAARQQALLTLRAWLPAANRVLVWHPAHSG